MGQVELVWLAWILQWPTFEIRGSDSLTYGYPWQILIWKLDMQLIYNLLSYALFFVYCSLSSSPNLLNGLLFQLMS